jgi:hypothetical protein
MALTLVKEDGSAKVDANSYAEVADGDSYHEGHLYATAWTGATEDQKKTALVMATRLIDSYFAFIGFKKTATQALQWPRTDVPDTELSGVHYISTAVVPREVKEACCEQARELLIADRTVSPEGEGLKYSSVAGVTYGFDKNDKRPVLSNATQMLLARFSGSVATTSVRLVRS